MTLRQKTLLLIGVTLIGLLGVLYTTLSYLLMQHLYEIEQQRTRQEMRRALNVLSEDVAQLGVLAHQWGAWNETYTFMENSSNISYLRSNLSESTFLDLRLNVIVLIRTSGEKVFGKSFNLKQQKIVRVPQELAKQLTINSLLLQQPNLTSDRSGILILPEGALLIASQPILTNENKGPARGSLIMGRYLNTEEIERLEALNQLSLTVKKLNDPQLPPDFQKVSSAFKNSQQQLNPESSKLLASQEIVVRPLNEDEIAGYVILKDIYNKPALILRVDMSRAIHKQGRAGLRYLIICLFGVGLVFCIGTLFLLEKLVLLRLAHLSDDVKNIGTSGDLSMRVLSRGKDELSSLGTSINWMLEALETSLKELKNEQQKAEHLLLNILPQPIAQRLKQEESTIADSFSEVTVLFADIVGFTKLAANTPPVELVKLLNQIFSAFDRLVEKHGLEKIKTIGDAYMVVGGLPIERVDHAEAVAKFALDMQQEIAGISKANNQDFNIRIGINSGPVVAGVIGIKKFIYDLWGDTVNIASRMESHGIPGCIQVTAATYERLQEKFEFKERGVIQVKGKGEMPVYLLMGKKELPR